MASRLRLKRLLVVVSAVYGFLVMLNILSLPRDLDTFLRHPDTWLKISVVVSVPPNLTRKNKTSRNISDHRFSSTSGSLLAVTGKTTKPMSSSFVTHRTRTSTLCPMRLMVKDNVNVKDFFKPSPHPVTKIVSAFVIQPPDSFCNGFLDILVLVPSSPSRGDYREAIRETWGSGHWPFMDVGIQMTVLFLLGRPVGDTRGNVSQAVMKEAAEHRDVLMVDADDGYRQMTVKMLAGLLWLSQRCSRVRYVARVDEDHFLNLPLFFHRVHSWFTNSSHGQSAIVGKILCSKTSVVHRTEKSKHHVNFSDYPYDYFPSYMKGGTYVMSADLVPQLVNMARYVKAFTVDDAYITGVLVRVLHVLLINLPKVIMEGTTASFLEQCSLSQHDSDPYTMRTIWKTLHEKPSAVCELQPNIYLKPCARQCSVRGYYWKP
ncbi:hypothetical protein ACOMHN_057069 [Nucella lapillus]